MRVQRYGVSQIHLLEHPGLEEYAPEAWAKSITQLMESVRPLAVLAAATERGNEILARVGAMTALPMAANCVEVNAGSPFRVLRYRWGSSLLEEAQVHGDPKLITLTPHLIDAREAETPAEASLARFTPTLRARRICASVFPPEKKPRRKVST